MRPGVRAGRALLLGVLFLYFGWLALEFVPDTIDRLAESRRLARVDYTVFHGAGEVISDGNGRLLYQPDELQRLYRRDVFGPGGPYIFPPSLGLIFVPFAQFSINTGYALYTGLSLVLFLGVITLIAWQTTRSYLLVGLVLLAVFAYRPFNIAVIVGQPSLPLAACLGVALLALQGRRTSLGAAMLAGLAIKPQFTILPTLMLLPRRLPLASWAIYVAAGAALVFGPFILLGLGALPDFLELIREESSNDFSFRGGARLLYSWAGFLAWLTRSDVEAVPLVILLAITAVPALIVAFNDDLATAMLGALLGSYLIFHSLIYDWSMLIPAAVILALRPAPLATRAITVGLILLLHVASSAGIPAWGRYSPQFWTPLAGYLLLVWLALRDPLMARLLPAAREEALAPQQGGRDHAVA